MSKKIEFELAQIKNMLRPLPDRYWTIADIAARLQVSDSTARALLKIDPDAPQPLAAQTSKEGALLQPRYSPARINEWLEKIDRRGQASIRSATASASAR